MTRLIKGEKIETQATNIRNEKEDITTGLTDTRNNNNKEDNCQQLYANEISNKVKIFKFLKITTYQNYKKKKQKI